jgi:hypothetical protein
MISLISSSISVAIILTVKLRKNQSGKVGPLFTVFFQIKHKSQKCPKNQFIQSIHQLNHFLYHQLYPLFDFDQDPSVVAFDI